MPVSVSRVDVQVPPVCLTTNQIPKPDNTAKSLPTQVLVLVECCRRESQHDAMSKLRREGQNSRARPRSTDWVKTRQRTGTKLRCKPKKKKKRGSRISLDHFQATPGLALTYYLGWQIRPTPTANSYRVSFPRADGRRLHVSSILHTAVCRFTSCMHVHLERHDHDTGAEQGPNTI